jgi:EAL domain-containing protein (putative c-di-GMP-specific phosphodiesterase class I)
MYSMGSVVALEILMYVKTVLLLEDNPFQRAVIRASLERIGINEILEAADGNEALELLGKHGWVHAAICDLRMPGMDGLAFLGQVAETGLLGAVIINSEVEEPLRQATATLVAHLGMNYLGDLGKPFSAERIDTLMSRVSWSVPAPPVVEALPGLASEAEVRRALHDGAFKPYFQPKFNIQTNRIIGAEVLARWIDPQQGVVGPGVFLPVIESCGLLDELLCSQLEQGLRLQRVLQGRGIALPLAFNLNASQLANRHLVEHVSTLLVDHRLPASGITFELTETGLISGMPVASESLVRLRLMGCGVSMDDFGSGFSSLARLCEFPFTEIKLDASFIKEAERKARAVEVLRGAIAMARSMDIDLVVEGVESDTHLAMLHSLGGRIAQGYGLARPQPVSAMEELSSSAWLRAASSSVD